MLFFFLTHFIVHEGGGRVREEALDVEFETSFIHTV